MPSLRSILKACCVALAVRGAAAQTITPQNTAASLTAPATGEEIDALVQALGDPSYDKRTFATRRLCSIGTGASEKLRLAESHPCPEIALRAGSIRATLDRLWFSGAVISVVLSQTSADWDQPVDLLLTLTNPTSEPVRVPFELRSAERSDESDDAGQVGDMLDAADWLRVRNSQGRQIDLRVDEVSADPKVTEAVQARVSGGPIGILGPSETFTVRIGAFNRGWARYPMLDRGDYTISFEYLPTWEDDVLAAAQAGRVVSNSATLAIRDSAPDAVSRRGVETSLTLERRDGLIVARLVNRTDQTLHVNKNFDSSPPFAQARWVYERESVVREFPFTTKPVISWHDFDAALVQTVAPGDSIELARISVEDLRRRLIQAGAAQAAGDADVYFGYSNLLTRQWQVRQQEYVKTDPNVPAILRDPLPRTLFSGWHTSNRIRAFAAD